jgi:hypothetical protein
VHFGTSVKHAHRPSPLPRLPRPSAAALKKRSSRSRRGRWSQRRAALPNGGGGLSNLDFFQSLTGDNCLKACCNHGRVLTLTRR